MIGSDIYEHQLVELTYMRANVTDKAVKRIVEPVAILFSEYYFYLNAYIVEKMLWESMYINMIIRLFFG